MSPHATPNAVTLRQPNADDMRWVVQQHGNLYWQEFHWNGAFESLVAQIVAGMVRQHDPQWERGWIAELNGQRVGSVFVVRKAPGVAQLRLLLLTPAARGLGLGARLTDECLAFARSQGYSKMVLWTHANLSAARAIYAQRGFKLVQSDAYRGFGHEVVGENWELAL